MQGRDVIGWTSSLILLVTLTQQVYEQWKSGTSRGVSPWLFVGQLAASVGFSAYSILLKNWVFVVTNSILVLNALIGQYIVYRHRHRQKRHATETDHERHENVEHRRSIA